MEVSILRSDFAFALLAEKGGRTSTPGVGLEADDERDGSERASWRRGGVWAPERVFGGGAMGIGAEAEAEARVGVDAEGGVGVVIAEGGTALASVVPWLLLSSSSSSAGEDDLTAPAV